MATNNRMIAHLWANQSKPRARGSNFYFDGPTLYSYGSHFVVGKLVERNGQRAALLNNGSYSVSTGRHQSYARSAVRADYIVFNVREPGGYHPDNCADYQSRIDSALKSAARRRKASLTESDINDAKRIHAEAVNYAEFFGLDWRPILPDLSGDFLAELSARLEAERKAEADAQAKRDARLAAELAELADEWRQGLNRDWRLSHLPVMLRVNGDTVETSKGAEVPADHARRIWPAIKHCKETGTEYRRNGHTIHVGNFQVDRVEPDGTLHAGCHVISYQEMQRCAALLGIGDL